MVDLSSSFSATFTRPGIIAVQWITGARRRLVEQAANLKLLEAQWKTWMMIIAWMVGWCWIVESWIFFNLSTVEVFFPGIRLKSWKLKKKTVHQDVSHHKKRFTMVFSALFQRSPAIPSDPQGLCCICAATMSLGFYGAQVVLGNLGRGECFFHRCNILSNPFFFFFNTVFDR